MNTEYSFYDSYLTNAGTATSGFMDIPIAGVDYPHPYYDWSKTYTFKEMKELFELCEQTFDSNEVVNAVVSKMAEYPVTDIKMQSKGITPFTDKELNRKIRPHLIQAGYDYFGYGNTFIHIMFDFTNYVVCPKCGKKTVIDSIKATEGSDKNRFKIRNKKLVYLCKSCGATVSSDNFVTKPVPASKLHDIIINRLHPKNIKISHNSLSGKKKYEYNIPKHEVTKIKAGDKFMYSTTPAIYLKAALKGKLVDIYSNSSGFIHLTRDSISGRHAGWGRPLIQSVLKSAYHYSILKRAQFTIASQMIVPMNILYARNVDGKLTNTVNMSSLYNSMKVEIAKWRRSHAYVPFFPVPVEQLTLGGQGKSLFLAPELESSAKTQMMGMHVPQEFIVGGLQWSASSITIRMLENQFLRYRSQLQIVLDKIADFIKFNIIKGDEKNTFTLRLEPLRMGDDMQRKSMMVNLASNNVVSKHTLLQEIGLNIDFDLEQKLLSEEKEHANNDNIMTAVAQAWAQIQQNKIQQESSQNTPSSISGVTNPLREVLMQHGIIQPGGDISAQGSAISSDRVQKASEELRKFIGTPKQQQEQLLNHVNQMLPPLAQLLNSIRQKGSFDMNDVTQYIQLSDSVEQSQQQQQQPQQPQQQQAQQQQAQQQQQLQQQAAQPQQVPQQQAPQQQQMPTNPMRAGVGTPEAYKRPPRTDGGLG